MSNDREDLEARIAAYIDGELPPAEAARLEVFLANTDPKLAEQVIGMIGDRHQLRALPKARAPEDLAARIVEQVERATLLNNVEHFNTHHRPWWQSRAALAAGLLLVLGGFSYFILEALHPANPAWQAALETTQHPVAAVPPSPVLAAAPAQKPSDASMPSDVAADNQPMMAAAGSAETLPASPVAGNVSEQPVLLTLVAQNADDVGHLHAALETLLADEVPANRRQAFSQQAAFAKASSEVRAQATQPAVARKDDHQQQSQSNNIADNVSAAPVPMQNNVAQAATADQPLVYHLTLRPAQLERLTQQFQVQTLTRDNQPFVISSTGQLADRDNQIGGAQSAAAATAPGASSTDGAPIECVITIVPPSSTTRP
jgi:anti-sigma factor RsiW